MLAICMPSSECAKNLITICFHSIFSRLVLKGLDKKASNLLEI